MTVSTQKPADRIPDRLWDDARRILDEGVREAALRGNSRAVLAYSGGKDGLAAALVTRAHMGVTEGVCDDSFYFSRQRSDLRATAEALGFDVAYRDRLDMAWLAHRPAFVFPDTKAFNAFCAQRQRRTFALYARETKAGMVVTGRKRRGNSVAKPVQEKDGIINVHPLASWGDEHVWRIIMDHGIDVPWIYTTAFGVSEGNSPWPLYRTHLPDRMACWRVVHDIEPPIVHSAAEHGVADARTFMEQC